MVISYGIDDDYNDDVAIAIQLTAIITLYNLFSYKYIAYTVTWPGSEVTQL